MKKTFLRILPLAVAVLFATSCSKDENNDNNVVNNGQENVVVKEKTVSVSGSVNVKSGISKLATSNGTDITFDGTEVIDFSDEEGKIHGSTTVAANGSFTVNLSYPASEELSYLNGKALTATIGTAPTDVQVYSDFATALAAAYEISNEVTLNVSEETVTFSGNVVMNINVAFVKNEKTAAINVQVGDNEAKSLAAGGVAIVPTGVKVTADGKTKNTTVAGAIYTIEAAASVPDGYVDLGIKDDNGKSVYWAQNNVEGTYYWEDAKTAATNAGGELPTKADFVALYNNCYWQWGNDGTNNGYYVFKPYDEGDKQRTKTSSHEYSTTSGDPCFFLPVTPGHSGGKYWSGTEYEYGTNSAFCLNFASNYVGSGDTDYKSVAWSVRTVRRSN
ncbi:MAG: hypothetical protein II956_15950 [Bacteroidales bacterium]|nr:hypothetical protein [Bacteroidales bacterium]